MNASVRRFRELEIELAATAEADAAVPIVRRLRDAGAGSPDPTPKIARALGPRATAPPDLVVTAAAPHHDDPRGRPGRDRCVRRQVART